MNLTRRSIQRQIFKIRLGVKSLPLVKYKISSCIYCDYQFIFPQSEAIHFVTDCPALFNARQKLLDYIKIEERALYSHHKRSNRQTIQRTNSIIKQISILILNPLLVFICITYTFLLLYHKLDVYQGDVQVSCLPNLASNYRYNKNTTCLILLYRLLRTN